MRNSRQDWCDSRSAFVARSKPEHPISIRNAEVIRDIFAEENDMYPEKHPSRDWCQSANTLRRWLHNT